MRVHTEKPGERELRATFSFDPSDIRLEPTLIGTVVHLQDCVTAGDPGSPALPKLTARLTLPPRTRLTGMDVRTLATRAIVSEAVAVAPLQLTRAGKSPRLVPANPLLYEQAMRRPVAQLADTSAEGFNPIVALELNPVRLTPDARLELQSEIEVILRVLGR